MTLQEILYKISVEKDYSFYSSLFETQQIKGLKGKVIKRLKHYFSIEDISDYCNHYIIEFINKKYKHDDKYGEAKFVKYINKGIVGDVFRKLSKMHNKQLNNISLDYLTSIQEIDQYNNKDLEVIFQKINTESFEDNLIQNIDLKNAFKGLSYKQKYIIYNIFFKGKTERQIALELKITQQTVNKIKKDALQKLKKIFL